MVLDFKELVLEQCPQLTGQLLRTMKRQYIQEVNLTLFNFKDLVNKLKPLFHEEKCFFEQVSTILVKLMSNELLNDNERYVATVYKFPSTNFGQNIDYKSKIEQSYLNMPKDGP
jgi:hypothetical protein